MEVETVVRHQRQQLRMLPLWGILLQLCLITQGEKKQCGAHNTASRVEAAEGRWSQSCVLRGAEIGHRTGSVRKKNSPSGLLHNTCRSRVGHKHCVAAPPRVFLISELRALWLFLHVNPLLLRYFSSVHEIKWYQEIAVDASLFRVIIKGRKRRRGKKKKGRRTEL